MQQDSEASREQIASLEDQLRMERKRREDGELEMNKVKQVLGYFALLTFYLLCEIDFINSLNILLYKQEPYTRMSHIRFSNLLLEFNCQFHNVYSKLTHLNASLIIFNSFMKGDFYGNYLLYDFYNLIGAAVCS